MRILIDKPIGQTPLQAVDAWKAQHPQYKDMPATYAGRLDPMASGKLLVLLGEECKKQAKYRGLDKEYRVEILLDLSTDTGDVLGMPTYADTRTEVTNELSAVLTRMIGTHSVPYPAFSSKTVNGKPLFQYALEGALDTISVPVHDETIYGIRLDAIDHMPSADVRTRIMEMLALAPRAPEASKVLGSDFRQDAIRAAWESLFASLPKRDFTILTLTVACASGTYMRTLAERIGSALGTRGIALSIHRTEIGRRIPLLGIVQYF